MNAHASTSLFQEPRARVHEQSLAKDRRWLRDAENAAPAVEQRAAPKSSQLLSLLSPAPPHLRGLRPRTAALRLSLLRAGFARLPRWGREIPSPGPNPMPHFNSLTNSTPVSEKPGKATTRT